MIQENNARCDGASTIYRVGAGASMAMLACWWILSWVLGSLAIMAIGGGSTSLLRWAVVVQNVVMFIMPAVMTMLLITSRPFAEMKIDRLPSDNATTLTLAAVVASIPLLNKIVALNEAITLPESFAGLEVKLQEFEDIAEQMIVGIMGEPTAMSLIVGVLLVGILTGLSEEVFFRGALQPIMCRLLKNGHVAVWATAFIFSAMHFEFFGFVPRLLLGAFLGYLVWWSGSLWLSIVAHAFNNSLVIGYMWVEQSTGVTSSFAKIGEGSTIGDWLAVVVSLVLVAYIIRLLYLSQKK